MMASGFIQSTSITPNNRVINTTLSTEKSISNCGNNQSHFSIYNEHNIYLVLHQMYQSKVSIFIHMDHNNAFTTFTVHAVRIASMAPKEQCNSMYQTWLHVLNGIYIDRTIQCFTTIFILLPRCTCSYFQWHSHNTSHLLTNPFRTQQSTIVQLRCSLIFCNTDQHTHQLQGWQLNLLNGHIDAALANASYNCNHSQASSIYLLLVYSQLSLFQYLLLSMEESILPNKR